MKVSVVLTTWNRRTSLARCLSTLASQSFPSSEYEVVVVIDGSTDDTVDYLRSISLPGSFRWFVQPNRGQPAAQNAGVAAAVGEFVLFIDDDCVCTTGVVEAHYRAHQQGEKLVTLGPVLLDPDTPPGIVTDIVRELDQSEHRRLLAEGARRRDLMLCANSSVSRQAALQCPFDTTFARMHDVEAGIRLGKLGYRPRFVPEAIVYEQYLKDEAAILRDARLHGRYDVILVSRHPEYKHLAGTGYINDGSALKRTIRRLLAVHGTIGESVLRNIYWGARVLSFLRPLRSVATRILKARAGTAHLRAAIAQVGSWGALRNAFGKRVPVIMYHNVGVPRPGEYPGLTTPVTEFENQISWLGRMGYQTILPSEWLAWRNRGASLPAHPIMLVFDDAYREAAQNAFPVLERAGFSAACMVVTGCIGSTNRWDEKVGRPSFPLMSADEIRFWSQRNIEFGGHSVTHPWLPDLPDDDQEREIRECREDLARLLGSAPCSFAYPSGGVGKTPVTTARCGFEIAFTTWPGRLHLRSNPLLAPRISFLPGETRFGMWCRLRLGRNPREILRNRWGRLVALLRGDERIREPASSTQPPP